MTTTYDQPSVIAPPTLPGMMAPMSLQAVDVGSLPDQAFMTRGVVLVAPSAMPLHRHIFTSFVYDE